MKLKKMTRAQIAMGVISLITVYLIVCQLSSVHMNTAVATPEKLRVDELQTQLTSEKEKSADLALQLAETQQSLETYRSESASSDQINNQMKNELDKANTLSGLTDLKGSGVVVTLSDSSSSVPDASGNYEQYIIHDGDLRMVLTELLGAGAEAVSVNGQRIIGTSAVRCVGNTIMINDVKIATPFEITAIGEPGTLEAALMIKGGVADYLKSWSIELNIKKQDEVKVPRYSGIVNFKYAEALTDKEGENK